MIFLIISVTCRRFENGLSPHFQTMLPVAQNPWRAPALTDEGQTRRYMYCRQVKKIPLVMFTISVLLIKLNIKFVLTYMYLLIFFLNTSHL